MTNIIAGTAGHIDHGKSALVRALTGIEPDRWEEERRRGISIDLGFAHLDIGKDLRIGFIDVPGHERFVRNMLAGAAGIDLVLLVVGADESIKPQTREHFDICRLLGIRRGIVVLTKADLVDREILDLVRLEVEEFVAGSFLEGAPIIAVSSKTGEGIEELKRVLAEQARAVAAKSSAGHFRLPVDRSFAMKGFGTVVTGTLISGQVGVDQEVEVAGRAQRLRVRGIQVHGAAARRAVAGQRTAINLAGVEATDLARGMTLVAPGRFHAVTAAVCEVELLPSAKPLKHRAPVHFHAWTAETEAEVRFFDRDVLRPGERALARLLFRDPLQLLPGDRFIVRMFSPVITIGGGGVIDISAPPRRMPRAAALARANRMAAAMANPEERIALLVEEAPWGLSRGEAIALTGLPESAVDAAAQSPRLVAVADPEPRLVSRAWIDENLRRMHEAVAGFHRRNPLLPGAPKEEFRTRELQGAPDFLLAELLQRSPTVMAEGEVLRLKTHRLRLEQDEETALARIESAFEQAGLAVPALGEVLARCGVEPARARNLLQILYRQKRLTRISEDLVYHPAAIAALRQMLAAHKGETFTVPQFKDWTGVSRKYAIPLLEFLDRERVTRRQGDQRIVI